MRPVRLKYFRSARQRLWRSRRRRVVAIGNATRAALVLPSGHRILRTGMAPDS